MSCSAFRALCSSHSGVPSNIRAEPVASFAMVCFVSTQSYQADGGRSMKEDYPVRWPVCKRGWSVCMGTVVPEILRPAALLTPPRCPHGSGPSPHTRVHICPALTMSSDLTPILRQSTCRSNYPTILCCRGQHADHTPVMSARRAAGFDLSLGGLALSIYQHQAPCEPSHGAGLPKRCTTVRCMLSDRLLSSEYCK